MKTKDIINSIYYYYPQNIGLEDIEEYTNSKEYKNRLKACLDARMNNVDWTNFKVELNEYVSTKYGDELNDYSILGNTPCYSATFGFGKFGNNNSFALSVLISIVVPLWSYRIIDFSIPNTSRFKPQNDHEKQSIQFLQGLIAKTFSNYNFIDEEQHQIVVPDISTAYKSSPTIFEAVFKEDLN